MFSPNPAPSTAESGYTRARTPQGGMSPTARCSGHACEDAWFAPESHFPKLTCPDAPNRVTRTAGRKKMKKAVLDDVMPTELGAESSDDEEHTGKEIKFEMHQPVQNGPEHGGYPH